MVLTCSTSEGVMIWLYNGVVIQGSVFAEIADPVGASRSLQASGFMFSVVNKASSICYHIEFQC